MSIIKQKKDQKILVTFNETFIKHFLNKIMRKGKISVAENVLKNIFIYTLTTEVYTEFLEKYPNENVYLFFFRIINKIKPLIELKTLRLGRKVFQIPFPIKPIRQESLGLRSLIDSVKKSRQLLIFSQRLVNELHNICHGTAKCYRKLGFVYKNAYFNKAFAHYRWY
jgi:small subunit ribosomal protein S7